MTRGWLVVTGGSLARLAIGLIPSVIIARTLGPTELGVFLLLAAVAATVGALSDLGLTESAVKRIAPCWPDAPDHARLRTRSYFWIRTSATSIIAVFGLLFAAPIASRWPALGHDGTLLSLALIGIVATALSGAVSGILQATGHFGRLSLVMITNTGLTACLAIVLWAAGHLTLVSALVVLGIGTSVASFLVGRRLLPHGLDLALPARAEFASEARTLLSFGLWIWMANVLTMLTTQLDLFLAGHWLDPATIGAYALALSLASKADVVNQSLHTALLPMASTLGSRTSIRLYLRRSLIRSSLIAAALLPFIPLAHPLITFFFGPAFEQSAAIFRALLGVAIFDLFAAPMLLLAFPTNRPQLIAAANGLRCLTLIACATLLVPIYGPYGLVLAKLAAKAAGLAAIIMVLALGRSTTWRPESEASNLG